MNLVGYIAPLVVPFVRNIHVGGTTDLQVGVDEAKYLTKGNPRIALKLITGMNHVLKNAPADRTLNHQTYNNPELPLHQDLIPLLTDFINKAPAHRN